MERIKIFLLLLSPFILGFGIWYLVFWFITGESNIFDWNPWVKALYLFFGFTASTQILDKI